MIDYVLQHVRITTPITLVSVDSISTDVLKGKVVVDLATPYQRNVCEKGAKRHIESINLSVPWVIITSNPDYYNSEDDKIIYYPFYVIDGITKAKDTEVDIKSNRNSIASFLTYHFHSHRLHIFMQLIKQTWFSKCLVNLDDYDTLTESQLNSLKSTVASLTATEKRDLDELFSLAPLRADITDSREEIVDINNRAFRDSYINIMSESDYPSNFVTEKSIKPFLAGQLPAVLANAKVYTHLTELGFDLLSEYVDLNTTHTTGIREKVTQLLAQVSTIENNIEDIWASTYHQRLHNYNLIRDPVLYNKLTSKLQQWLDT